MKCGTECPLLEYCPVCGTAWEEEDPQDHDLPICDLCEESVPQKSRRCFADTNDGNVIIICEDCILVGIQEGSITHRFLEELE